MLYNLQAEDPIFLRCILNNPKIRSILISELNDQWYKQIPQEDCNFILRAIAARSGGPEPLPLHIDSFVPSVGPFSFSIQVAIILEDQNIENGCTTVVPGSHLKGTYAGQSELKNAVPILSSAGDAVIWDSRLWHGTNGNISGSSRWSVVSTFVRWWVKQNYNLTRSLPNSIYLQLTNEEKAVMGYCSIPPLDEYERIDIKAGYDALKANVADYFK